MHRRQRCDVMCHGSIARLRLIFTVTGESNVFCIINNRIRVICYEMESRDVANENTAKRVHV